MIFKTVEGVLHPDGTLALPKGDFSDHAVRVMVTLLEATDDAALAEVGDYSEQLRDYEERLARGEIGPNRLPMASRWGRYSRRAA